MIAPPPDLSQGDKNIVFYQLDLNLNHLILQALFHGLYTGIVAVTLYNIFTSPKWLRSIFLRVIIISLYVLLTISLATYWAFVRRAFIQYGRNYYWVFLALVDDGSWWQANYLIGNISGGIGTFLVDITIIWRCWTLWDRQWIVVFAPILCAVAGTAMKTMEIITTFHDSTPIMSSDRFAANIDWSLTYILLALATSLICTGLIIYRIIRHASGISASHKIIAMLIESLAIYSLSLIVYIALVLKNPKSTFYADVISAYIKAIAPTLLVGRISAYANTISARQKMVAMWEDHPPLVGCFRDADTNDSCGCHCLDDGHQTSSGSSGKETV
ncbi:hypothetical protein EDD85DRAFT_946130 [Armillaria nabsnona]|nr:hypothetical protein EDD85DRAFT_946130 [Armillaria nabsnona]